MGAIDRKKALRIAIPVGIMTGITAQLLIMLVAGWFPPDGWTDLTLGLIIGLSIAYRVYRNLVEGKYAKKSM